MKNLPIEAEVLRLEVLRTSLRQGFYRHARLLRGEPIHDLTELTEEGGKEYEFGELAADGISEKEARTSQMGKIATLVAENTEDLEKILMAIEYRPPSEEVITITGLRRILPGNNGAFIMEYGPEDDPKEFDLSGLGKTFDLRFL